MKKKRNRPTGVIKRSKRSRLNVNGVLVEAVTIAGLGEIIGRSRDTILRYERNGTFPPAPLLCNGYRYYPVPFAEELAKLVRELPLSKAPDAKTLVSINRLFKEETDKYAKD